MPQFLNEIQLASTGSIDSPSPEFVSMFLSSSGFLFAQSPDGTITRLIDNE